MSMVYKCRGDDFNFKESISFFQNLPGSYKLGGNEISHLIFSRKRQYNHLYQIVSRFEYNVGDLLMITHFLNKKNLVTFVRVSINDETGVEFDHFATMKVKNLEALTKPLMKHPRILIH
jgi:hypothetical protein